MTITNITNFRNDIFKYLNNVIDYSDVIHVTTKNGNAIVLNEEEYNGLIETIYLCSDKRVYEEIIEGKNTPIEECIKSEDVVW